MAQRPKSKKKAARAKPSAKSVAKPKAKSVARPSPKSVAKPRAKPSPSSVAKSKANAVAKPIAATKVERAATPQLEEKPKAAERRLPRWMADHIQRYLATNGADGHIWRGVPTLLLITTGRRSGEERLLPLIYGRDGDRYLVVGSRGGAPDHPAWYKNLVADPEVQVQVGGDRFRARARTANRDERPRLWRAMTRIWPDYDKYQCRTQREIPVVLIERH